MIIIINGACGVGKTTLASKLALRFNKSVHIEADKIHNFITNSEIVKEQIEVTDKNINDLVENFKNYGYEIIIIDNVYETEEHLLQVVNSLQKFDADIITIRVCCEFKENIIRDRNRNLEDVMGRQMIEYLHKIFNITGNSLGTVVDTTNLSIEESVNILEETVYNYKFSN